ncbi:hypothetical protein [Methylocystis heyeri]|uniref:Uncharacterized protein n=1 Tax=Methylocystis heyeri TaxID=391905 RepID=A0A6B8KFM1_9HYPH|nr:hypothetical protein [Methylocystis heyeri]QGM46392.1 hypothetical protein H2LOC_012190 [Methylocystis heyeri]
MPNSVPNPQDGASRPAAASSVSIRHGALCVFWGGVLLASVAAVFVAAAPKEARLIGLLAAIYSGQGLIVEIMGLQVGGDNIVVPRRWGLFSPLFIVWRRRFATLGVKSILAKPKSIWGERVLLEPLSGGRQLLLFSTREQKLAFFKAVTDSNHFVSIYRTD